MRRNRSSIRSLIATAALALLTMSAILLSHLPALAGELEPIAPPGPTMRPLDRIPPSWSELLSSGDGEIATGCNSSRFVCVLGDNAVLDQQTGLTWTRNANQGQDNWLNALSIALNGVVYFAQKGWRLPTPAELASLVEEGATNPSLPPGHPFLGVQSGNYWTSRSYEGNSASAWVVSLQNSVVSVDSKLDSNFIWLVRGPE